MAILDRTRPPEAGPLRPFHLPIPATGKLENGLRIRSMKRSQVPLVSVCLVLDAGETGVAPGSEGIAVLAGDALQGGTTRRSGVDFAEAMERLGTAIRVSTGWDATTLTFTCVAERLDEVLALGAEAVRHPLYPEDEVERVRAQRLAAIRQRKMEPGQIADDWLDRVVFREDHPYHRPLSGTEGSVGAFSLEGVRGFARESYTPNRGGVAVVGDLDPSEVEALTERYFGEWDEPYPGRRSLGLAQGPVSRRVVIVHRPGAVQSELRIGHPAPARGHEAETAIRVANSILGGSFSSRLNLNLRERHGFTYGVSSRFAFRRHGGAFTVRTATATEVTPAALEETMTELANFQEDGPTGEEVARARDYLAGVFPLQMETTAQLASRLAELLIFDLPDNYHVEARERIRGVGVEAAAAAAAQHIRVDDAAVVVVGDAEVLQGPVEALGLGAVEVVDP